LSLTTRLLAFALFIVGGFAIGYVGAMQSIAPSINNVVVGVVKSTGNANLAPALAADVMNYIQQNVTPTVDPYLAVGAAMAIGGFILVVMGDRKPKSTDGQSPLQSQPTLVKQQE
jgi:hypothetical protein